MKEEKTVKLAYHDPGFVTQKFILNVLARMNRELGANFEISNFELEIDLKHSDDEDVGKIQLFIKSLQNQKYFLEYFFLIENYFRFEIHGKEFFLSKNERIHIEDSHKFQKFEIDMIAQSTCFFVEDQWLDQEKKYTLNTFAPFKPNIEISDVLSMIREGWGFADYLFECVITPEALQESPIQLRHPFIFYLGHLCAFEKNQIFKYLMKKKSDTEAFDELFERGIDPLVDNPSKCHKHSAEINYIGWPDLKDLLIYRDKTRKMIEENLKEVLLHTTKLMAQKGRVFTMVHEHTMMHVETLLYMIQELDPQFKQKISLEKLNYDFGKVYIL